MSYDRPAFDVPSCPNPISPILSFPEISQNQVDEISSLSQIEHALGLSSSPQLENASYPPTQFLDPLVWAAETEAFSQLVSTYTHDNSHESFQLRCDDSLMESPNFQPQVKSSQGATFSTGQMICSTGESQVAPTFHNIQTTQTSNTEGSLKEGQSPNVSSLNQAKGVSSTKKLQQSRCNFTREEDILLISACLKMDMVEGNQQKSSNTNWKRIHEYFHKNKRFTSARSQESLKNRWFRVKDDVETFCEYYAQVEGRQQNGVTEETKIFQAMKLYEEKRGREFQLQHCWQNLRYHSKWTQDPLKKNTKTCKNASSSSPTPDQINLQGEDDDDDDAANNVSIKLERQIDRKAQKRQYVSSSYYSTPDDPINLQGEDDERPIDRKAQKKEFVSSKPTSIRCSQSQMIEYTERMRLERMRHERLGRIIALEEAAYRSQTLIEEERIMAIDITSMKQLEAQYYESRQKEIMAKRIGTGFR